MKISIIGTGNVGWHLAHALEEAGHWICEVYSRKYENAAKLAAVLYDTDAITSLDFSESNAEIIILSVSDNALNEVMEQLVLPPNIILVNTSGTITLAELQKLVEIYSDVLIRTGIFYPLQSFSKNLLMDYADIPFCVESREKEVEKILIDLAETISTQVKILNSYERLIYHIAAVFASNFTNQLITMSHDIVVNESLNFDLLKPLIRTTIEKALLAQDPADALTGPARRGDYQTIDKHLDYLEETDLDFTQVYRLMTEKIQKQYLDDE